MQSTHFFSKEHPQDVTRLGAVAHKLKPKHMTPKHQMPTGRQSELKFQKT